MKTIDRKRQPIGFWQDLVRNWTTSSLSQAEFSRKHVITLSRFRYWVRKLGAKPNHSVRSRKFVQVPVPLQNAVPFGIELELPGGITLRLARTDAETLKTVLRSVRETAC